MSMKKSAKSFVPKSKTTEQTDETPQQVTQE